MDTNILVGIIIGLVIAYVLFRFLSKKSKSDDLSILLDQKLPDAIKSAGEHLVLLTKQNLEADKKDISNTKKTIEDAIKRLQDDLKQSIKQRGEEQKETVGSFRALKQELETHKKVTEELSVTADGLKRVLSNNQLRGQFGEQVAEDLLKMTGFVKGVDYETNKNQKDSQGRPDFTIFLPDGVKISVDAKFPYANLQRLVEAKDGQARKEYIKAFETDVREKIKQVTTRNYINPEANTVDFVILFIPNEMIFSYIYDKMNEIWSTAMRQKVVFAGPFSFTAILRLVRQSYDTFKYQKNVQKIITQIKNFEIEFQKYNEEFEKIGMRIGSLTEQYDRVNTTRTKQLMRSVDKIRLEESASQTPLLETEAN